jgi:hypothetical protein
LVFSLPRLVNGRGGLRVGRTNLSIGLRASRRKHLIRACASLLDDGIGGLVDAGLVLAEIGIRLLAFDAQTIVRLFAFRSLVSGGHARESVPPASERLALDAPTSAQSEEGQDGNHDDDETNDVDKPVHACTLATAAPTRTMQGLPRNQPLAAPGTADAPSHSALSGAVRLDAGDRRPDEHRP